MKIKIAFYKGKGDFINTIVRWWTKSIYSHAELILPDDITSISINPFFKSKITRRLKLEVNYSEWDFIEIAITPEQHVGVSDMYFNGLDKDGNEVIFSNWGKALH